MPGVNVIYDKIRNLSPEEIQGAWVDFIKKGQEFVLNNKHYVVTTQTNKTIKIKCKENNKNFNGRRYKAWIHGNSDWNQLCRDIEGLI